MSLGTAYSQIVRQIYGHALLLFLVCVAPVIVGCDKKANPDEALGSESQVPQAAADDVLLPARRHGLYGFIDSTGTFKIEPQFTYASRFVNGLAVVGIGGSPAADYQVVGFELSPFLYSPRHATNFGAINKRGEFVIAPRYACLSRTSDDGDAVAAASIRADSEGWQGERDCTDWSIVDVRGGVTPLEGVTTVLAVAGKYFSATTGDLTSVLQDETYLDCDSPSARRQGKCVERGKKAYKWVDTRKTGLMSTDATWLLKPQSQYEAVEPMADGMALVTTGRATKIVDPRGLSESSSAFGRSGIRAEPFHQGLKAAHPVATSNIFVTTGQFGFVDSSGRFAIQPQFDDALDFTGDLALVRIGGLWGFVNIKGEFEVTPQFLFATHVRASVAFVCTLDKKLAVLDVKSKDVKRTEYSCAGTSLERGFHFPGLDAARNIDGNFLFPVDREFMGTFEETASRDKLESTSREKSESVWINRAGQVFYGGQQTAEKVPLGPRTGTAFAVTANGQMLTNAHVVDGCEIVQLPQRGSTAKVTNVDRNNDLALLNSSEEFENVPSLGDAADVKVGTEVVVFGFPLTGALSSSGNLTVGVISAASGVGDDTRYFQISAPIQPGNSGGAVLNRYGDVVGIATASLDSVSVARATGSLPQNVNFAITAEMIKGFLRTTGLKPVASSRLFRMKKSIEEIAKDARDYSTVVECSPGEAVNAADNH